MWYYQEVRLGPTEYSYHVKYGFNLIVQTVDKSYGTKEEAARRVNYLNGGSGKPWKEADSVNYLDKVQMTEREANERLSRSISEAIKRLHTGSGCTI